ncbi:MAG: TetR/AcrR family transcriptional regulator [Acidimicrobiales bacterium]
MQDQRKLDGAPSVDEIVEAATDVLHEVGPAGLTLRRVARQLGVPVQALHWHFADADELVLAAVDRALKALPGPPPGPWDERLVAYLVSLREQVRPFEEASQLASDAGLAIGDGAARLGETMMSLLAESGAQPERVGAAFRGLFVLIFGWSAEHAAARERASDPLVRRRAKALRAAAAAAHPLVAERLERIGRSDRPRAQDAAEAYRRLLAQVVDGLRREPSTDPAW